MSYFEVKNELELRNKIRKIVKEREMKRNTLKWLKLSRFSPKWTRSSSKIALILKIKGENGILIQAICKRGQKFA